MTKSTPHGHSAFSSEFILFCFPFIRTPVIAFGHYVGNLFCDLFADGYSVYHTDKGEGDAPWAYTILFVLLSIGGDVWKIEELTLKENLC